jgi:putative flippase GtrA
VLKPEEFLVANVALVIAAVLAIIALYIWMLVWVYGDANARGKSGCIAALLVLIIGFPFGLLAWLFFRPDTKRRRRR